MSEPSIHPSAEVHPRAEIAAGVEVGPFCAVGAGARLGSGCRLRRGAIVESGAEIGEGNEIGEDSLVRSNTIMGADNRVGARVALGDPPLIRDLGAERGFGRLEIGSRNCIRENVAIHVASAPEATTLIGNDVFIQTFSLVGHDALIGDGVTISAGVLISGHVHIADRARIGVGVKFHQHCRVGTLAMVGASAYVSRDVPPFVLVDGNSGRVVGLNQVGLRRAGITSEDRRRIKAAYRVLYRSERPFDWICEELSSEAFTGPASKLVAFLEGCGERGLTRERKRRGNSPESER